WVQYAPRTTMLRSRLFCLVIEHADPACSSTQTTALTRGRTVKTKARQSGRLSVEHTYRRSLRWTLVLGLIAAFLAIVVAAEMLPGQSPASSDSDDTEHAEEMDFVRRDADDPMAIGDVDAPVVLSEFIDMRCPFCAVVSRDIMPKLIEEYVDTGKVRIEFHDLVFYGDQSEQAAVAARAAGEQDKYFEF